MRELIENFISLFTESAPFLLLGLLLAGIVNQLVPPAWIKKTLGKNSSVGFAAIIGTPLPLCSCSVIPTAIGIRRAGASKASTASFMVATPETGVDSIGITLALMGPMMAIVRPFAAIISAITVGTLVRYWDVEEGYASSAKEQKNCCHDIEKDNSSLSIFEKTKHVVTFGYGKLLSDFMSWLLIGLIFASLIQTFVPNSVMISEGNSVFAMLVIVLISIPMYICATASTPIAAGLMLSGISPGAALVFMLAGPATNIATLMVVKNELGMRSLIAYLTGVIVIAMIMGLGFDYFLDLFELSLQINHGQHSQMTSNLYQVSALILASLIIWQYLKKVFS